MATSLKEIRQVRLNDGSEQGEVMFMDGFVRDTDGKPIAGAIVDV